MPLKNLVRFSLHSFIKSVLHKVILHTGSLHLEGSLNIFKMRVVGFYFVLFSFVFSCSKYYYYYVMIDDSLRISLFGLNLLLLD